MTDDMTATPEQKKELRIKALGIAGFTENSEYPMVFTQEHGMKKIVKDLNAGGNAYFLVDKKKVTEDDEYNTRRGDTHRRKGGARTRNIYN